MAKKGELVVLWGTQKKATAFGNGAHIIVPKAWIGRKFIVVVVPDGG